MFFTAQNISDGVDGLSVLVNTLYNLLPHLRKFSEVNINIPEFILEHFISDKNNMSQVYNQPERSKHVHKQLNTDLLNSYCNKLYELALVPFMRLPRFQELRQAVDKFAESIGQYALHLRDKNEKSQELHCRETVSGKSTLMSGNANYLRSLSLIQKYKPLEMALRNLCDYQPICVNEYAPLDTNMKSKYMNRIALPFCYEMIWASQGNNKIWFIWKIPNNSGQRDINKSSEVAKKIEDEHVKRYHSRTMRRKFVEHYDKIILNPKKCSSSTVLEEIYQDLTGDMSASSTIQHEEVKHRLRVFLDTGIENPDIAVDLREINSGQTRKYDIFFEAVENYISERTLNAAHERRHDEIGRLAVAISIRDLISQVSKTIDSSVPVPSESYLRLQFWPKNKHYHSALNYTGRFNLRYQIQTRQLRGEHVDSHYANMVFRHLREFLIKFREQGTFLSIDDKCHVKVGEPGSPVACAQRGRQMIVHGDGQDFTASDHDFTKFKLVPSAVLVTDIPQDIGGSFYQGNLHVILKDQVFETSKPFRHAAELKKILELKVVTPIVAIYSDGGPDHRITYLSVQVSLIALFVTLDLDILVAARTAPLQSFRNPVERCMATLNLGLQFVSISRAKMDDEAEKAIKKSNTLKALRDVAEKNQDLKDKMKQSVHQPIELLESIFERLQYTSQPVCTTGSASEEEISKITQTVIDLDPNIDVNKLQKCHLKNYEKLSKFMDTHCVLRHYFVSIKKCTDYSNCEFCSHHPPRLPLSDFMNLQHLPDPVPGIDQTHYKSFDEVWGNNTSEEYRPSLQEKTLVEKKKTRKRKVTAVQPATTLESNELPNSTSEVTYRKSAETVRLYTACYMCGKPRCLYSQKKLSPGQLIQVEKLLEDNLYSCGAVFPCNFIKVEENITCEDDVSIHYFSTRRDFPKCCYACGDSNVTNLNEPHPVCEICATRRRFRTRGGNKKLTN